MIDLKTLRELVKLMVANDLSELDLQDQGERVSLKRGKGEPQVHYIPGPPAVAHGSAGGAAGNSGNGSGNPSAHATSGQAGAASATPGSPGSAPGTVPGNGSPAPAQPGAEAGLITITSPMVGTFYASPNPDSKPFAAVGDRISAETVVCIIEAMKVFNEIKAEKSGAIEKILVANGQAVEFGQPMFLVRPT